jgi:hypothetical protein
MTDGIDLDERMHQHQSAGYQTAPATLNAKRFFSMRTTRSAFIGVVHSIVQ